MYKERLYKSLGGEISVTITEKPTNQMLPGGKEPVNSRRWDEDKRAPGYWKRLGSMENSKEWIFSKNLSYLKKIMNFLRTNLTRKNVSHY